MLIFRGLNQAVGNANTIPVPDGFTYIGGGFLPDWGPDFGYNNSTLLLGLIIAIVIAVASGASVAPRPGWAPRRRRSG